MIKGWTDAEVELVERNFQSLEYADLASILGRTENAIRNLVHRMGWRKKANEWGESDIAILVEHYARATPDLSVLEQRLGRSKPNISRKARELGLTKQGRPKTDDERQSMSQRTALQIKTLGHPKGFQGKTHNAISKALISEKSKAQWLNPNSKVNGDIHRQRLSDRMMTRMQAGAGRTAFSRGSMGKRDDLNGLFVRSSWEANYARYLNWLVEKGQIQKWEYEPDTFVFEAIKRGTRSYMPDFKVLNKDGSVEYHEVKGWMDKKSATKLKRMARYYPHIKIVLIDADEYKAIKRAVSSLIEHWEFRVEKL